MWDQNKSFSAYLYYNKKDKKQNKKGQYIIKIEYSKDGIFANKRKKEKQPCYMNMEKSTNKSITFHYDPWYKTVAIYATIEQAEQKVREIFNVIDEEEKPKRCAPMYRVDIIPMPKVKYIVATENVIPGGYKYYCTSPNSNKQQLSIFEEGAKIFYSRKRAEGRAAALNTRMLKAGNMLKPLKFYVKEIQHNNNNNNNMEE